MFILYVFAWFTTNFIFNVYLKRCHTVSSYVINSIHFFMAFLCTLPGSKEPLVPQVIHVSSILYMFGTMCTNVLILNSNVSMAHIIKATEPAFVLVILLLYKGERPSLRDCIITSIMFIGMILIQTNKHLTMDVLLIGVISNILLQWQKIIAKETIQDRSMQSVLFALWRESFFISVLLLVSNTSQIYRDAISLESLFNIVISGFAFLSYQYLSYYILEQITPFNHSIFNVLKRVMVCLMGIVLLHDNFTQRQIEGTVIIIAACTMDRTKSSWCFNVGLCAIVVSTIVFEAQYSYQKRCKSIEYITLPSQTRNHLEYRALLMASYEKLHALCPYSQIACICSPEARLPFPNVKYMIHRDLKRNATGRGKKK